MLAIARQFCKIAVHIWLHYRNYSGSREEVQLLAGKSFGQPEKKLNFWLSSYTLSTKVTQAHQNLQHLPEARKDE